MFDRARSIVRFVVAALVVCVVCGCGGRRGRPAYERDPDFDKLTLTVCAPAGADARRLERMLPAFEEAMACKAQVVQAPVHEYREVVAWQFSRRTTDFDVLVVPVAAIGQLVQDEHIVDLSLFLKRELRITTIHPAIREALCEYPAQSGQYVAAPFCAEFPVLLYRKDRLGDREPPQSIEGLLTLAAELTDVDAERYGIVVPADRTTRGVLSTFHWLFKARGGSYGDPESYEVAGHLDAAPMRRALEDLRRLLASTPPSSREATVDQVVMQFTNGRAAMAVVPLSTVGGVMSALPDVTGVTVLPGQTEEAGPAYLHGYAMVVSARVAEEQGALAHEFVRWFLSDDAQADWRARGGFAVDAEGVVADAESNGLACVYGEGLVAARTFWKLPVADRLMDLIEKYVGDAADGYLTDDVAIENLVSSCEVLLREVFLLRVY